MPRVREASTRAHSPLSLERMSPAEEARVGLCVVGTGIAYAHARGTYIGRYELRGRR